MLSSTEAPKEIRDLNAAELGAIAHLYRGEIYRSTIELSPIFGDGRIPAATNFGR